MIKYLLPILFLTISPDGISQSKSSDTSASCVAYWRKGETKKLSINRIKENNRSAGGQSNTSFEYDAEVVVLDSTSQGYKVQWTFHLPKLFKDTYPGQAELLPVFEGMKMVFTTSQTGTFGELLNWQEVKETYTRMMELSLPKKLDSAAQVAIDKSKELFNSREMVESTLINEIQLYYFPFGFEFSTRGTKSNISLPNPFTDEPLPAFQTNQVTEINPKEDYFKLVVQQEINKLDGEKVLEAFLRKMDVSKDSSTVEAKKMLSSFEIREDREYFISQSTGWVKTMRYKRTVKNDQVYQTDSYSIKMSN
jgi:hypothetical protein